MSDLSKNSITIEASADEVSKVLFDLAEYPNWSTAIKSVEVLEKDATDRGSAVEAAE